MPLVLLNPAGVSQPAGSAQASGASRDSGVSQPTDKEGPRILLATGSTQASGASRDSDDPHPVANSNVSSPSDPTSSSPLIKHEDDNSWQGDSTPDHLEVSTGMGTPDYNLTSSVRSADPSDMPVKLLKMVDFSTNTAAVRSGSGPGIPNDDHEGKSDCVRNGD